MDLSLANVWMPEEPRQADLEGSPPHTEWRFPALMCLSVAMTAATLGGFSGQNFVECWAVPL